MKNLSFAVLAAAALWMTSCGSGAGNQTENQAEEPATEASVSNETASVDSAAREVSIIFPSAVEIMTVFKNAGLTYQPDAPNNRDRLEGYTTRFQKAIGTGIYTADLAYCVVNGQNQEAVAYMQTVLSASGKVGIPAIEKPDELLTRFNASLGEDEEVLNILTEVQEQSDDYIEENDMEDMATLVFSGAWIEGMYLAIQSNREYDREKLSSRLVEQMDILNNVVRALESMNMEGEEYAAYVAELSALNTHFRNLESVQGAESMRNVTLSIAELKDIGNRIKTLRTKLA